PRQHAATSPWGPAPTTAIRLPSLMPLASGLPALPVREELLGRVLAVRAHDAAPRMGGGAAHVEAADRRLVLRPAGNGTQEKELLEGELALEDVALGQSPLALEVER